MIRPAVPGDARDLAEVQVRTWEEAYRGIVPDELIDRRDVAARERVWRDILAGDTLTSVAEADGEVVGFISVGATREPDLPFSGELFAIYLRAAHWGGGLGSELMLAGERQLRELGYSHATLWVLRDNPRARRFYEKHGWGFDGSEKGYPGTDLVEVRYARELTEPGRPGGGPG